MKIRESVVSIENLELGFKLKRSLYNIFVEKNLLWSFKFFCIIIIIIFLYLFFELFANYMII